MPTAPGTTGRLHSPASCAEPRAVFYEPVLAGRHFAKTRSYDAVNKLIVAGDRAGVVDAFAERIGEWYLEPIRYYRTRRHSSRVSKVIARLFRKNDPGHFAFAAMAIDCLIIDTMSQFVFGELALDGATFIRFIENYLPNFRGPLTASISHHSHYKRRGVLTILNVQLTKVEEVIWHGFRCGILHQAHAPLYCRIDPGGPHVNQEISGRAQYADATKSPRSYPHSGSACPTITINPWLLFDDLESFFQQYVLDLKDRDPRNEPLRDAFKKKFTDSFGLDITRLR